MRYILFLSGHAGIFSDFAARESCVPTAEEIEKMRKELVGSLAASVAIHVLLFVCFFGRDYREDGVTKVVRIRREVSVTLSSVPMTAETGPEPLPVASDSQHVPHKMERAELPRTVGEKTIAETLLRLGRTPSLSALDSLRMAAIREEIARPEAVVDSSERRRLRIKRNFEEIKRGILAWQQGKGELPGPRFGGARFDGEGPRIGGGVAFGFPTDWEGIKRAGRHRVLAGKSLLSKKGVEAIFELSALEFDIVAVVWTSESATPKDVYWKVARIHRASYTDIARAMEELTLRWKVLWETGKGIYASAIGREEVIHFLGQTYLQGGHGNQGRSEVLEKLMEVLEP